jgi:sugar lactone lactonase YvrE
MLSPELEVLDPRFARYAFHNVHLERLYTGCRWAEGPAYFAAGRYLIWSDIPNDRVLRWDETDGSVSVFMQPAWNAHRGPPGPARQLRAPGPLRLARRTRRPPHRAGGSLRGPAAEFA